MNDSTDLQNAKNSLTSQGKAEYRVWREEKDTADSMPTRNQIQWAVHGYKETPSQTAVSTLRCCHPLLDSNHAFNVFIIMALFQNLESYL